MKLGPNERARNPLMVRVIHFVGTISFSVVEWIGGWWIGEGGGGVSDERGELV